MKILKRDESNFNEPVFQQLDAYIDFKDACLKNRMFLESDFLDWLHENFKSLEHIVFEGDVAYRARLYEANLQKEEDALWEETVDIYINTNKSNRPDYDAINRMARDRLNRKNENKRFKGFNAKGSFVNLDKHSIAEGRCNYKFVPCLYMADTIDTAISEVKPTIGYNISVAKIKVLKDLKLIDFRYKEKNDIFKLVSSLFTQSVTLEFPEAYIYTQVICDFIKNCGYDGVIYSSCQNTLGANYAIFNYEKCKAISSEVYTVDNVVVNYSKRQI